jgi:ATP/ADP translocase
MLATIGMTTLLAAVYVGALQNIFSMSAKYSLFDPYKEMTYIPLDEDVKVFVHPSLITFLFLSSFVCQILMQGKFS